MKLMFALHSCNLAVILKRRQANRAILTFELLGCDARECLHRFRAGHWLLHGLVETQEELVVVRRDLTRQ